MDRSRRLDHSFSLLGELVATELAKIPNLECSRADLAREKLSVFLPEPCKQLCHLTGLLDQHLYECLRTVYDPIPRSTIASMRENYGEQLPKTMRFKSSHLTKASKAGRVANFLGILDILNSEKLRLFGEGVTGKRLQREPGCQVICYESGDFSGPHNDHHPEQGNLRRGYVDVHIMLSEPTVLSQLLVYEKQRGLLNEVREVGRGLAIAVYQLPFWHYTTPLMARPDAGQARRWLFIASYAVDRRALRSASIESRKPAFCVP
jgi:hypothetical protein